MSNEEIYYWQELDRYIEHCKINGIDYNEQEFYQNEWAA